MVYKVKEVRKEKGLTQEQLSEQAGVARGIIVRLESEKEFDTSVKTLNKLAVALGCKVSDIFLP